MSYSRELPAIDLMMAIPGPHIKAGYDMMKPLMLDADSLKSFNMPAQYLFRDIPKIGPEENYVDFVIQQMDRFNIRRAMVGYTGGELEEEAIKRYPDRFLFDAPVNPNRAMEDVKRIREQHAAGKIHAASFFPAGTCPQVPIDDRRVYPIYTVCSELDIPIFINVGVPGPRAPGACQKVELLDEICYFFPDLKIVMRHGAEPWEDLAVKLMLKWPNLYYSTSAFAPRHYPKAIVDFANSRGADKILYAGYFPMGLSLDRIFGDFDKVAFKPEVWPKFLYQNAARLFKLPA